MRWEGHVARMGKKRITYGAFVEKLEEKWPLGKIYEYVVL
jgi:hypothetical protein